MCIHGSIQAGRGREGGDTGEPHLTGWTWPHARARPFSAGDMVISVCQTADVWRMRTLMAYELDEPFAALMSSSARHSAMDLTFRNADSRVCVQV
jgi:hypothetical protein